MNEQSSFKPSPIYLESLDSVRATPLHLLKPEFRVPGDPDDKELKVLAKIEMMLALLFGHQIVLPRAFGFDSRFFLELAAEALDAQAPFRDDLSRLSFLRPFALALPQKPPFDSIAYRKIVSDAFKNPDFILSATPIIGRNPLVENQLPIEEAQKIRNEFGEAFLKEKDLGFLKSILPKEASLTADLLTRLGSYFSDTHTIVEATSNLTLLDDRVSEWRRLISEKRATDPYVEALDTSLETVFQGKPLSNRSQVRKLALEALYREPSKMKVDVLRDIIESVDSLYNHVMSHFTGAESNLLSTGSDATNLGVLRGEDRATYVSFGDSLNSGSIFLHLDAKEVESSLQDLRWDHIWEIMASDEWQGTCRSLHSSLGKKDRIWLANSPAIESLDAHVTSIADRLAKLNSKIFLERHPFGVAVVKKLVGWTGGAAAGSALGYIMGGIPGAAIGGTTGAKAVEAVLGEVAPKALKLVSKGRIMAHLQKSAQLRYETVKNS